MKSVAKKGDFELLYEDDEVGAELKIRVRASAYVIQYDIICNHS